MYNFESELRDLEVGSDIIKKYPKGVTVFGSARTKAGTSIYNTVRELGSMLGDTGFSVITGGGPGLMEAANRGAYEVGGLSVGLGIKLPFEQHINKYCTYSADFENFHIRKKFLIESALAIVCTPGGWGTVEEITEVLTLLQTAKISKVPVFFLNQAYWAPLLDWFEETLCKQYNNIDRNDLNLYYSTDSVVQIVSDIIDLVI